MYLERGVIQSANNDYAYRSTYTRHTEDVPYTGDILPQYTNRVQRVGVGNYAPARYQPVRGLEAHRPRVRGRQPDRASCISPQRAVQGFRQSVPGLLRNKLLPVLITHALHWPAATATALPPELPPGERSCPLRSRREFLTGPNREWIECDPIPNSSRFVFPATMAPAAPRSSTTVALNGLLNFSRILDAQVVGRSHVQMLSLTDIKRPSTADFRFPVPVEKLH